MPRAQAHRGAAASGRRRRRAGGAAAAAAPAKRSRGKDERLREATAGRARRAGADSEPGGPRYAPLDESAEEPTRGPTAEGSGPSWLGVALTLVAAALAYYVRPSRQARERDREENRDGGVADPVGGRLGERAAAAVAGELPDRPRDVRECERVALLHARALDLVGEQRHRRRPERGRRRAPSQTKRTATTGADSGIGRARASTAAATSPARIGTSLPRRSEKRPTIGFTIASRAAATR